MGRLPKNTFSASAADVPTNPVSTETYINITIFGSATWRAIATPVIAGGERHAG